MEEDEIKRKPLDLDWNKLLPTKTGAVPEEEPPRLVVVPSDMALVDCDEHSNHQREEFRRLNDKELIDSLDRQRKFVNSGALKLCDGGEKLQAYIKRLEDELDRRQRRSLRKDDEVCKQLRPEDIPNCCDTFNSGQEGDLPSGLSSQSTFAVQFCNRMDENINSRAANAFEKELSTINRCENLKTGSRRRFSSLGGQKRGLSTREAPFQSPGNLAADVEEETPSSHVQKGRCISVQSPCSCDEGVRGLFSKRFFRLRGQTSNCRRREKGEHVVVVDEEEVEAKMKETHENVVDECVSGRIYYPSRDDSEAVEICSSDMKCLAPEEYLSSTIMNFYIRYLQGQISGTDGKICIYHFFSTYFYEKLKEAVMNKSLEEASFAKFRRWWKGVNIFQKAYIFIPIHESLHWSLLIICIPDKVDESGPILMHLDSLGLHSSKSIFSNIKRFLIEEWKIVKEEALSDLPIADKIWERLPRRIDEKVIEVPQQRNDYDCGLFVLFFMKRFIDEAPKRLRKKDFPTFGRQWFNPKEASSLRCKIKSVLIENFEKSLED